MNDIDPIDWDVISEEEYTQAYRSREDFNNID